jgi:arylformamidase
MIEYPLCPSVRVSNIASSIVSAIEKILHLFPSGPVTLSGHSAGGQLVSFATSRRSGLSDGSRVRIGRVISLSGIHDVRPLVKAQDLNADLRLTEEEATDMSPALDLPGHDFDLYCICGGGELDEFKRQTMLLATVWGGWCRSTQSGAVGELDHFRLLDELTNVSSHLTGLLTGM